MNRYSFSLMIDYTIFYKSKLPVDEPWADRWDLFISAYNSSERVREVYARACSAEKHWLIHPEYGYKPEEYPVEQHTAPPAGDEAEFFSAFFGILGDLSGAQVCVDITGMMRPHLMLLPRFLQLHGVSKFDVLYSEPGQYVKQEHTSFSLLPVVDVRPVMGFEGTHVPETSKDLLIIGSGYDHPLITHAAEHKKSAKKVQLFGLPSLRPDMYQENVLKARWAEEAIGGRQSSGQQDFFAPANDPFVVASVVQEIVRTAEARMGITNLYLCPLATKPQALGFALYYLSERVNSPTSIIFPFAQSYSRETSAGLSRVWKYTVEILAP